MTPVLDGTTPGMARNYEDHLKRNFTSRSAVLGLVLLLGSALATAQAPALDPAKVVLVVNGEEVKAAEYYRKMEFLPGVGRRSGNTIAEMPPGLLALDQIVTEKLILQLAKEKGVLPSDLEVNTEYAERKRDNPDLVTLWLASGRTEADLLDTIRVDLAQFKIQAFGITVTDQEVDRIFTERASEFTTPKQYRLSVIVVLTAADKDAVDADLTAGKVFGDVAKAQSKDYTAANGGQFGMVPSTSVNTPTRDALEKIKVGQNTEWISTTANGQDAFVKFRLEDIVAEKKDAMTPELRKRIRRKRMLELGSVKNDVQKEMAALRRRSKIDIRQTQFATAYKKLIDAYLNQPSSGTSTGGQN